MSRSTAAIAGRVLAHAMGRSPRLGSTRLVCVDGPSGSGKSTLSAALAAESGAHPCAVVHVDELFPGWDGQPLIGCALARLLRPMAARRDGWWRRWDYEREHWAEWHRVRGGGLLVLDGVGSGTAAFAAYRSTLVWVEAPRATRLRRGAERDDGMAEHWRRWQVGEDALHVRERTRRQADLVVHT